MTSLDHSTQLSVDEDDATAIELTMDASLLQDDFYRDEGHGSCSLDEEEELDDDPPCDYSEQLHKKSDLKVLIEEKARVAYEKNSLLGLFHLFLTKSWFTAMNQWTNQKLATKGKKKVTHEQFMAYIGLEILMSFVKLNQVTHYWMDKMFLQQKDFQSVMPRTLFQEIHGSLTLHDPCVYGHNIVCADPLHHNRN